MADRVARAPDVRRFAVHADLGRVGAVRAEDGSRDLGAPGADEPGEAEDLAAMQVEAHVLDGAAAAQVADVEHHVRVGLVDHRSLFEDGAPDHHPDDLLDRRVLRLHSRDVLAVAHDRDPVGDPLELFEAMRDVHDTDAGFAKLANDPKKLVDLRFGERGGRLVHDDDLRFVGEGLRDLDHLLLRDREVRDLRLRVDLEMKLVEERLGVPVEGAIVEEER